MSPRLAALSAKIALQEKQPETLAELVDPDLLVPRLKADNKIGAIKELVDRLYARGIVRDTLSFLQAVLGRENLESTILGNDVAMPHARSRSVNRLGMAVGISPSPIDYPSGDERQAIRIICLIAVPAQAPDAYLALLGTLARTFEDEGLKNALLQTTTAEELHGLLSVTTTIPFNE